MRPSRRHSHPRQLIAAVFPGQNLQAAPVSFGQGCSLFTTPSSFLTGKPLGPYSLGPFMVELFGGSAFDGVPAGVIQRNDRLPGRCLPTPATLCELAFEKTSPHPADGITPRQAGD